MKTLHYLFSIGTIFSLALLQGCDLFGLKKNDPKPLTELEKLPPATQEGKNTFGCLVNGKAWIPVTSIDAGAVYQLGNLQIYGNLYSPSQWISLTIIEAGTLISLGDYSLQNFPNSYSKAFKALPNATACSYEPKNTFSGKLTITKIDRTRYVVSGLFEFSTALNGCDTLKITNGRFDIKYIP